MTNKKLWMLYKPNIEESDAMFIEGLGCEMNISEPISISYTTPSGTRWEYKADCISIEIKTTCEKQESMLKLKYGDSIYLTTVIHKKLEPKYENIDMVSYRR